MSEPAKHSPLPCALLVVAGLALGVVGARLGYLVATGQTIRARVERLEERVQALERGR